MGISKSTFYRDMDELIQEGIVNKTDEGYSLSQELFPVFSNKKVEAFKDELDSIANECESFKNDRMYKTFYQYYDKGFKDLTVPPERFVMLLSSGFFFKDSHRVDSKKKDNIIPREYRF